MEGSYDCKMGMCTNKEYLSIRHKVSAGRLTTGSIIVESLHDKMFHPATRDPFARHAMLSRGMSIVLHIYSIRDGL